MLFLNNNLPAWQVLFLPFTVVFSAKGPWHKTEPDVIHHKQKINMTIGRWKYTVWLLNGWFYVQLAAVSRKLMAFLGSISVVRRIKQDPALTGKLCGRFYGKASKRRNDLRFHKFLQLIKVTSLYWPSSGIESVFINLSTLGHCLSSTWGSLKWPSRTAYMLNESA